MTLRARVVLIATVLAAAPFLAGTRASAASTSSNWWGVDTASTTSQSFLNALSSGYGTPQFVGRYVTWGGGTPLQASEATFLHAHHLPILLLASPPRSTLTSTSAAAADAKGAITRAHTLGVPRGTAIFRDVEASYTINATYVAKWFSTIRAAGYVPGFYANPLRGSSSFSGAYCAAVKANASIGTHTVLYADEPEFDSYTFYRSKMPAWAADRPPCANTTVAWQYKQCGGSCNPNVDVDELHATAGHYLWAS